jgi:hypothetical protein
MICRNASQGSEDEGMAAVDRLYEELGAFNDLLQEGRA